MRIFVCTLRLRFPDSKRLRGFGGHEIFGNFFRHSEIFGLHLPNYTCQLRPRSPPPPSPTNFLGALFILKVPFETEPPPNFLMLPTPLHTSKFATVLIHVHYKIVGYLDPPIQCVNKTSRKSDCKYTTI